MVGSSAALKMTTAWAIHAPRTLSRAENSQKTMKRWGSERIMSSRRCAQSRVGALGKFLESGIDFGNFDALEAGLQGVVMILIRGRQDAHGVPDDADMISFREPEFRGRAA